LKREIKGESNEFLNDGMDGNGAERNWRLYLSDRKEYINTGGLGLDQG
jgi:hypothetical protein